jgi:single-strand DNA-binding protein
MSYQSVTIVGTMGKDPQLAATKSGISYCKLSVATMKKKDDKEFTSWHNITAWGKTAEYVSKYAKKGSKIFIEGELHYGDYKKDGVKVYTTDIIAARIEVFMPRKGDETANNENFVSDTHTDDVPF